MSVVRLGGRLLAAGYEGGSESESATGDGGGESKEETGGEEGEDRGGLRLGAVRETEGSQGGQAAGGFGQRTE